MQKKPFSVLLYTLYVYFLYNTPPPIWYIDIHSFPFVNYYLTILFIRLQAFYTLSMKSKKNYWFTRSIFLFFEFQFYHWTYREKYTLFMFVHTQICLLIYHEFWHLKICLLFIHVCIKRPWKLVTHFHRKFWEKQHLFFKHFRC